MKGCFIPLVGRFGNQLFQFCYARAYADQNGLELHTPRWIGEKIFQIEPTPEKQDDDLVIGGYHQNQDSMIYTRKQVRQWFKFRPEIMEELSLFGGNAMMCHLRRGDYAGYGYPTVSRQSYMLAIAQFRCEQNWINWVSDDEPTRIPKLDNLGMPFLMDFYKLMVAPIIFRANSSFSWWAATLGESRVFSPIITGLVGGRENDCAFVEGNHPQLSETVDCTDMHLFHPDELLAHNLNSGSLVYEIGGYHGHWTADITRKFGCKVKVFEPCQEFYDILTGRFGQNPLVELHKAGVGSTDRQMEITWKGSMTSEWADGDRKEKSWMYDIADLVTRENRPIDLMQLNCEGYEYEILERLIDQKLIGLIKSLQVQFHCSAPDCQKRYAWIREQLVKTHVPTFQEPFVWEGFELR